MCAFELAGGVYERSCHLLILSPDSYRDMVQTMMRFDAQRMILHPFRAISGFFFFRRTLSGADLLYPFRADYQKPGYCEINLPCMQTHQYFLFLDRSSTVLKGRDMSTMGVAHRKNGISNVSYHSRQYLPWGLLTHSNEAFLQPRQSGTATTGIPKLNNISKNADNILSVTKYCQC